MLKGRLLASVCALGLLAAAPAFAAGPTTGDMGSSNAMHRNMPHAASNGMSGSTGMGHSHTNGARGAMHAGNTHHWSQHAMRSSRSDRTDASQNAEITHLNQESLRAAKQGHPFQVGSARDGSGGMGSGSRAGGMSDHGSGMMPGSGSPSGSKHM
ncbi:MAG TPA: hypothetical protein VND19_25235 [Acetobacteraceae bacterium]|nr:hypothetical protein [Acetobacteraceae bacterium]